MDALKAETLWNLWISVEKCKEFDLNMKLLMSTYSTVYGIFWAENTLITKGGGGNVY